MRAGRPVTPHRGWGVVLSRLYSFAFIIPLNYGIITKNNLNVRGEQRGPDSHLYPARREDNMLLLPEVLDHRGFSRIFADFGLTFA